MRMIYHSTNIMKLILTRLKNILSNKIIQKSGERVRIRNLVLKRLNLIIYL